MISAVIPNFLALSAANISLTRTQGGEVQLRSIPIESRWLPQPISTEYYRYLHDPFPERAFLTRLRNPAPAKLRFVTFRWRPNWSG
jgi:hypothetical protein